MEPLTGKSLERCSIIFCELVFKKRFEELVYVKLRDFCPAHVIDFHNPRIVTIRFQSPVMSIGFSKFHPNYVIGGTYSGQVILWDTRSGKRTPIQRSPLSSSAHTHPIYCLDVVGSQNAHNLISVSTDGKMCSWNLDMLSQPQVDTVH